MRINEKQVKSILTKSPVHDGYTINPYGGCTHHCVYCYASYLKDWTGHEEEKWGDYLDVKYWKPLTENDKKRLHGANVMISSATDPYQPLEMEYRRTQSLLKELVGVGAEVLIVTKSKNVVRDIGLFKKLNATVALSINTLDEDFRKSMDNASTIEERLETLKTLYDVGIHTVCFISPIFPGITDAPKIIERVTGICDAIWIEHLVLSGDYKGPVLYYVKTQHPEYYKYYEKLFVEKELQKWWQYDDYMKEWCDKHGYKYSYSKFPKFHREKPTVTNFKGHKGK